MVDVLFSKPGETEDDTSKVSNIKFALTLGVVFAILCSPQIESIINSKVKSESPYMMLLVKAAIFAVVIYLAITMKLLKR